MTDNLTTQSTTLATIPANAIVETRDQGSGVERQVVSAVTVVNASANFNRPANTTAYASGQGVMNSTTAASVASMAFAVANGNAVTQSKATLAIRRCRIKKTSTTVTVSSFRLHLYISDPTASSGNTAGDGAAFSVKDTSGLIYLGSMDVTTMEAGNDSAIGWGVPNVGSEINVVPTSANIYGLLEARAAYVPTSAETFTVNLEAWQF